MTEIPLPSGANLKITPAPFKDSRALLQVVMRKVQEINVPDGAAKLTILRKILASSLSSPEVDTCIWVCFKRCLVNDGVSDAVITEQYFEDHREDYMLACIEVELVNILPFLNGLSSELKTQDAVKESTPK